MIVDGASSTQVDALGQLLEHAATLGALSEAAAAEIADRLVCGTSGGGKELPTTSPAARAWPAG